VTPTAPPALRAESLTRYYGGLAALESVTFEVTAGLVKAILGPNGAGKTTLFDVLTGLQRPTAGRVICDGVDIVGWAPERVVREMRLARTFQDGRTWGQLSVLDTIRVAGQVRGHAAPIHQAAKERGAPSEEGLPADWQAGLLRFVGLDHRRDSLATHLTHGDQRRLELARALATQPRVLLLDEPAAGLDDEDVGDLARIIRELRDGGLTILLIEHRMPLVLDVADELLVLHLGKVVADGKPDDVRRNPLVVEVYLGASG